MVHLDIKSENILVLPSGIAKLCDFDCAAKIGEELEEGLRGTPQFIPPEALNMNQSYWEIMNTGNGKCAALLLLESTTHCRAWSVARVREGWEEEEGMKEEGEEVVAAEEVIVEEVAAEEEEVAAAEEEKDRVPARSCLLERGCTRPLRSYADVCLPACLDG